jgi:hypothetical protein
MEAFVHPPETERREFCFLPCVGDERARRLHLFFLDWPAGNFSSADCDRRRGEYWSRNGNESKNGKIRDAARTPRARSLRFDFNAGFYTVFYLTLEHHLNYLLNFRDDISGGAAARGLTTWDLIHRAGPAPRERVPRPSYSRTGLSLSGFRSEIPNVREVEIFWE